MLKVEPPSVDSSSRAERHLRSAPLPSQPPTRLDCVWQECNRMRRSASEAAGGPCPKKGCPGPYFLLEAHQQALRCLLARVSEASGTLFEEVAGWRGDRTTHLRSRPTPRRHLVSCSPEHITNRRARPSSRSTPRRTLPTRHPSRSARDGSLRRCRAARTWEAEVGPASVA